MKKFKLLFFTLLAVILSFTAGYTQKFCYVDSEYILNQMTEYKSAQSQLDQLTNKWKDEIKQKMDEIEKLYNAYRAEQVLLPEEVRKKREDEIQKKEDDLNKFKEEKFGKNGELFKKRQELVKPIQDKVFEAIQKMASEEGFDFVFDKSGAVTMLYVNAKYDRSDEVLDILGVEVKNKKD
ncbi:MAG TPA: OmpH family outer membrane protein [Bacteroidia bacterium]|nr:OmpH family outer membrane protein [Sphingobacteriales bacterium]HPD65773.1 OmpH family outer membrane protein [Bacteroidia bacterium]HRS59514.1 OmpH family outer membrane protein [Bacteroidia bacterium]HRU67594.1 OmpH family outer membrane protein [Bacteroidia bacterium]